MAISSLWCAMHPGDSGPTHNFLPWWRQGFFWYPRNKTGPGNSPDLIPDQGCIQRTTIFRVPDAAERTASASI
jgi:hypothetical protein